MTRVVALLAPDESRFIKRRPQVFVGVRIDTNLLFGGQLDWAASVAAHVSHADTLHPTVIEGLPADRDGCRDVPVRKQLFLALLPDLANLFVGDFAAAVCLAEPLLVISPAPMGEPQSCFT